MSKRKTNKDERDLLASINGKLTALLALVMRSNIGALKQRSISNVDTVKFLAECGLEVEEIANVLGTTKDGARMTLGRSKKKR